jgi:hypothetical protein
MQEELITFETAKLAKQKEFDESCNSVFVDGIPKELGAVQRKNSTYKNQITRPKQSLLQKWLREKHNIDVFVNRDNTFNKGTYCLFIYDNINDIPRLRPLDNDVFSKYPTYEKALEVGLQEALKLI